MTLTKKKHLPVWPVSSAMFGQNRDSADIGSNLPSVFRLFVFSNVQTCDMMLVSCMQVCRGHLQVRSLTCDDLDSFFFQVLLVSRLVLGADFEFSNHLNEHLWSSFGAYHITKRSVAVDTIPGRTPFGTPSVVKTNMKFVISAPPQKKQTIESSHCDILTGPDFSKFSVIHLTWNVNQWPRP